MQDAQPPAVIEELHVYQTCPIGEPHEFRFGEIYCMEEDRFPTVHTLWLVSFTSI